jgi:hypothetical protein
MTTLTSPRESSTATTSTSSLTTLTRDRLALQFVVWLLVPQVLWAATTFFIEPAWQDYLIPLLGGFGTALGYGAYRIFGRNPLLLVLLPAVTLSAALALFLSSLPLDYILAPSLILVTIYGFGLALIGGVPGVALALVCNLAILVGVFAMPIPPSLIASDVSAGYLHPGLSAAQYTLQLHLDFFLSRNFWFNAILLVLGYLLHRGVLTRR